MMIMDKLKNINYIVQWNHPVLEALEKYLHNVYSKAATKK